MRLLLAMLLVGIAGCGGGSSPSGGAAVPTPGGSQANVDNSPVRAAAEYKAAAKKSVEGQEPLTLNGDTVFFSSVSFSPDAKRIVSGSRDKTLKVWDISSLDTSE